MKAYEDQDIIMTDDVNMCRKGEWRTGAKRWELEQDYNHDAVIVG